MALAMVFTMSAPMNASANNDAKQAEQNGTSEGGMEAQAAVAEQLAILGGSATLHEDLQALSGEQEVAVIIHLSEKPIALEKGIKELAGQSFTNSDATRVEKNVKAQQASVKKEMSANKISFKEGYSYATVFNGFAATVKANDLSKLIQVDGVVLVEPDEIRYTLDIPELSGNVDAANNTSISHLGIEKLWNKGFKGKGIKVGVIDTGIDYNHPEFDGVYKGGKNFVPNNGDYARPRDDNDPYETSPLDRDPSNPNTPVLNFATTHGTHVSGTIAGIGANPYGISGLAPEVELHVYRVLGAYGSGNTSWVIKGIDTAVQEGMDVINLSLGGPSMSSVTADSFAINNAMLAGTVAAIATGNSGSSRGSIGSPASAALGIAVGNSTNPTITETRATLAVKAESYDKSYSLNYLAYKFGEKPAEVLTGEYDLVAIPNFGKIEDYEAIDVDGKVVLVSRGDITFVEKIETAKKLGAKAVIIHNNVAGLVNASQGSGFTFITTFDMSGAEGTELRNSLSSKPGKISFGDFVTTPSGGDTLSSSSSRGPTNPDFDIKPDVVAPGTNIMSTVPAFGKDIPDANYSVSFGRKTGTSMATPHIAAISALILQANPGWTPFDVKVSLSNSAKLFTTTTYDVFAQGPGRVQPYEAAFPKVLAYALDSNLIQRSVVEHEKGTVRFGKLARISQEDISVTKQIRVEDIAKLGGDYTTRVLVTKAFAGAAVAVDKSAFTLNGTEMLNVTLTAPQTDVKTAAEILGYIYIEGNGTEISLPFAAEFTPSSVTTAGVAGVKVTNYDISFASDSVNNVSSVSGVLGGTANYKQLDVEITDLLQLGEEIGTIHSKVGVVAAGPYNFPIEGKYTSYENDKELDIPDGAYTFSMNAMNSSNRWFSDTDPEPLFIKSTPSTINTAELHKAISTEYEFKGTIVDTYIDLIESLVERGYTFDVNEKLTVSFEALNAEEEKIGEGPVVLEQDGAFSLNLTNLTEGENTVTINVDDAAGNEDEFIYTVLAEDVVSYAVDTEELNLKVGDQANLTVTETTTKLDGSVSDKDVTLEATYAVLDEKIATVSSGGKVAAVGVGTTEIIVSYEGATVSVSVKVEKKDVYVPPYTPPTNPTPTDPKPVDPKPVTPPVFTDITNIFAKNEINKLAALGTIQGKTETLFAPNAQITRAEFAVLLARALKLPTKEYEGTFSDVNTSKKWAFAAVEAAARAGIVNGTANGNFNPDAPIKREEIAAMVIRAIEYQDKTKLTNLETPANFKDHGSIGAFAIDSVYKATALGVILGNNGQFNPKNNATRAEAAVMLYRALEKLELLD